LKNSEPPNATSQGKFTALARSFGTVAFLRHVALEGTRALAKDQGNQRVPGIMPARGDMLPARLLSLFRAILPLLLLACAPGQARAAVDITFYSKEFGTSFPHAYVALKGTLDRSGERIDANYGFTATHVSPAVLMGSVEGEIMSVDAKYQSESDAHFTIRLSDAEYDQVIATVERWRTLKQPSYNLNRQNCVFFVAHVAAALGMTAETPRALMKKPRSYLELLGRANRAWLAARGSKLLRDQPGA
jgi:hypothetical protein